MGTIRASRKIFSFLETLSSRKFYLLCWVLKEDLEERSIWDSRTGWKATPRFPNGSTLVLYPLGGRKKKFPPSHYKNNTGLQLSSF